MSLIDYTFFHKGSKLELPDTTDYSTSVISQTVNRESKIDISRIILEREREFLNLVLGKDITNDFYLGLKETPVLEKWINLKNKLVDSENKISPIANYVYFFAIKKITRKTNTSGISSTKQEISTQTNPIIEQCEAWNEIDEMLREVYLFLVDNYDDYEFEIEYQAATETEPEIKAVSHKLPDIAYEFGLKNRYDI